MFTCANSNILIIPRKHTHCVFKNNQKKRKIESIEGDLEGTGNVSVGLQQSHELLFSSHLPHQLDAHDQQHPLWMGEKKQNTTSSSRLHDRTFESARRRSRGRFEICETHPEHSAAKLDGHGQRERQLEFRDVDRQAGLQREGNNSNNAQVVRGTCWRVEVKWGNVQLCGNA